PLRFNGPAFLGTWWPVLLGLLVLYVPTYYGLATGLWNQEEHAHGPIVLMVWLYLLWRALPDLEPTTASRADAALGWAMLVGGLLVYAVGRSQSIIMFEVGSQVPVMVGAVLALHGRPAVRKLWFPLFFILFMIPLPGILVD